MSECIYCDKKGKCTLMGWEGDVCDSAECEYFEKEYDPDSAYDLEVEEEMNDDMG